PQVSWGAHDKSGGALFWGYRESRLNSTTRVEAEAHDKSGVLFSGGSERAGKDCVQSRGKTGSPSLGVQRGQVNTA
ncbi:hypothetical protein LEMLEM_LOCUS16875, partial [Lemmus lemmus]